MFYYDQQIICQLILSTKNKCHTIPASSPSGRSPFSGTSQTKSTRPTTGRAQSSFRVASAAAAWPSSRGPSQITCPSGTGPMGCRWRGAINSRLNQSKYSIKRQINACSSSPSREKDMISPFFTSTHVARLGLDTFTFEILSEI